MANSKFSVREFYNKHPFLSNLLIVIGVGFVLLWLVLIFLDYWTFHGSTAVVPQVKHKTYNEAAAALTANKLSIEISDSIYDRNLAPGMVIESWPRAGAIVRKAARYTLQSLLFRPSRLLSQCL